MSFDNYYKKRKDWRKPYKGSKRFDRSCRNHGSCPYCAISRAYNAKKRLEQAEYSLKESELTGETG